MRIDDAMPQPGLRQDPPRPRGPPRVAIRGLLRAPEAACLRGIGSHERRGSTLPPGHRTRGRIYLGGWDGNRQQLDGWTRISLCSALNVGVLMHQIKGDPRAKHIACTVEMASLNEEIEVRTP